MNDALAEKINELDGDEELLLDASTVFSPTKTTTLCTAEELKQLIGVSEWTKIEDGLPDDGTLSYWVTTKKGSVHLTHIRLDGEGFRCSNVIAWMPYPTEPQPYEVKNEN